MTRLRFFIYGKILGSATYILLILSFFVPSMIYSQVVSPRISITSSQDPSGILLNIKGTSFSSGSMVTLYAKNPDGSQAAIKNVDVSKSGSFNISHLFPAGYPPGTYLLWVVDDSTGKYSNRVNFNMSITQSTEMKMPSSIHFQAYTPKHGDLIRAKGDTKIYLVQNGQRRCFANEKVFKQWGFKKSDVRDIDPQDMINIPEGPPIWSKETIASFPDGTLIRLKGETQTYVIQGGRKCYIPDLETFQSRGYSWDQVKEVDQATLDSIFTGIPIQSVKPPFQYTPPGQAPGVQPPPPVQPQPPSSVPPPSSSQPDGSSTIPPTTGPTPYQPQPQSSVMSFPNGTLIKGSGPDVYLIENGVRRLIPDMETFNTMGLNWNNVTNVDDQKLGNIPMGIPIPQKKKGRF
jgi:hypothetical protein